MGFLNDLLPLPYDTATLNRVVAHIDLVQTTLGRQMLLENPSSYFGIFNIAHMTNVDFYQKLPIARAVVLLLDVNNVFVSCENMGWDIERYLNAYPMHLIGEIHLGGHDEEISEAGQKLLIDTHGAPVVDPVWELYQRVIAKTAPCPPSLNGTPMFPNGHTLSRCHTGRTDYDTTKGRGVNQDAFTRALLHPDLPTPAEIIAPAHDSATRRFAVYRNNVIASLSDALETAFPAIRALLGDTNFRNIACLLSRPSTNLAHHAAVRRRFWRVLAGLRQTLSLFTRYCEN